MRRISLAILVLALFASASTGQTSTAQNEAEKQKAARRAKLIEMIETDGNQLRLPENRAFISAKLGTAIAKREPERSASLFRNSIASLLEAQAVAEANKNPNHQYHDLLTSQSLRPTILTLIAQADADYALESFYRTRPEALQRAMTLPTGKPKIDNISRANPHTVQQEINLEQRLIKLVAEQSPERMIGLLREHIRKHLSGETFSMVRKVWEKDAIAGNELANEVVERLVAKPFVNGANRQQDHELLNLTNAILTDAVQPRGAEEKYIAYDEAPLRSLAEKLISHYVSQSQISGYFPLSQIEPIAKRFSPGSLEQLKKLAGTTRGPYRHSGANGDNSEYTKLMNGNPTADVMVAEAGRFPVETRRSIYQAAASKFSETGRYERALALLHDNFEGDTLENAISTLNWYYAHHLMNHGALEAAEAMMMEFNESNRIAGLISLANLIFNRNREENRSRALGILQRTRSFIPENPESSDDFSKLFQVINAMSIVDTDEAFRNFEPIVTPINELADAWSVVHRFQGGYIRQNEYLVHYGANFGIHIEPSLMRMFAQKDTPRTLAIINSLSRREIRLIVLLDLLQSGI